MDNQRAIEKSAAGATFTEIAKPIRGIQHEAAREVVRRIHQWNGDKTDPEYRRLLGIRRGYAPVTRPYQSPWDQDTELDLD